MREVGIIGGGAVAVTGGVIKAVGTQPEILDVFFSSDTIDVGDNVICPGFVDPHTHIVFAGDRLDEFEMKIGGAAYLDILAAGGGILSTVRKTRGASFDELVEGGKRRLEKMLSCGTTTAEIKTGYGLDLETELKMLRVIEDLDRIQPIDLVPTFLAAHAVPDEFRSKPSKYVDLICDEMLSAAWDWYAGSHFSQIGTPFFVDVFCEKNAFDREQAQRIFETASSLGFKIKAHVDEFTNLRGSELAVRMGAISIDHLDAISDDEVDLLASSDTIGIVTPTVNFNLGSYSFADARKLIDHGCAVALSTDYNPGSAPCPSQPMVMAIAARYQRLLPGEALNASTINAAYTVGLGRSAGSLEVGKKADMLILDSTDFREAAYEFGRPLLRSVFKNGKQVKGDALNCN
jgi:imidazolonepropionase